jgi:hypothetical protein
VTRRVLSQGESAIFKLIQDHYGSQNTLDDIVFSSDNEAVIWVRAADGTTPLFASLTNLSAWREDGSIPSDEELLRDWLRIGEA